MQSAEEFPMPIYYDDLTIDTLKAYCLIFVALCLENLKYRDSLNLVVLLHDPWVCIIITM